MKPEIMRLANQLMEELDCCGNRFFADEVRLSVMQNEPYGEDEIKSAQEVEEKYSGLL